MARDTAIDFIDGSFVPRRRPDASSAEIDGEMVVVVPINEKLAHVVDSHWLNPTASVVWKAYDGVTSVDELVGILSRAFDADPARVAADVLTMTRELARAGLFVGIPAERSMAEPYQGAAGLPIGTSLPPFRMLDLDGKEFTTDDLPGGSNVLIHWSPSCRFCIELASDVSQIQADLAKGNVALILIARGSREENLRLRDEAGLTCRVLLWDGFQPFEGLGTPVAYLIDESTRVASPLTIGRDQILVLLDGLASVARQGGAKAEPG